MRPPTPLAHNQVTQAFVHSQQKTDSPFLLVAPNAPKSVQEEQDMLSYMKS